MEESENEANVQLSDHPSLMSAPLSPTLVLALQRADTPAEAAAAGDHRAEVDSDGEEVGEEEEEVEGNVEEETLEYQYKLVKTMDSESSDDSSSYTSSTGSYDSSDSDSSAYDIIHISMDPIVARCQQTLRLLYHSDLHEQRQHWSDISLDTMRFGARPACVWSTMDQQRSNVWQPSSMFSLPPPQKARSHPSMPRELPTAKQPRNKTKKDQETETPPTKARSSTFKYSRNFSRM